MSAALRIRVEPSGEQLSLRVFGPGLPVDGRLLARTPYKLSEDEANRLRRGDGDPTFVDRIRADLTQWLFGQDLEALLGKSLHDEALVRLIFSIDQRLLSVFADLPVELVWLKSEPRPFVLHPKISAIVHLLPNVGEPGATDLGGDWPLRVLIVRSNPAHLGGLVPLAVPIRKELLKLQASFATTAGKLPKQNAPTDRLHIDLLTREKGDGVLGLPTPDQLRVTVDKKAYDVLVYLGHGDLVTSYPGAAPVGTLQLEEVDDDGSIGVTAGQLAWYLDRHAPPVVLLMGCLTAATLPAPVQDKLANFVRGSEGVAQALVESESGVHIAIGMRYRLDSHDATLFLRTFFGALLNKQSGNVELAVREARADLHFKNAQNSNYSAPVIFSTLREEPIFAYMATPPAAPCGAALDELNDARSRFWPNLASQPLSRRSDDGGASSFGYKVLELFENGALEPVLDKGSAIVMPVAKESPPDSEVDIDVNLHTRANVDVEALECDVVVNGDSVTILGVTAADAVRTRGYQLFVAPPEAGKVSLVLKRKSAAATLPAGTLFHVRLRLGPSYQVVHRVSVEALKVQPQCAICPASNGVIVPPP
jgi:hypothetical protein